MGADQEVTAGNALRIVSADDPIDRIDDPTPLIQRPTAAAAEPPSVRDDPVHTVIAVVRIGGGLATVHSPGLAELSRAALVVTVLLSDVTAFDVTAADATAADATAVRVRVAGELDLAVVDVLADALDQQLSIGRSDIELDVSRLRFCSCSGLEALLTAHHRLAAAGGGLTLTGLNCMMTRLLRLTGLEEVLTASLPSGRSSGA